MNYNDTLNYLYNRLPMFQRIGSAAYKANLDNTIALMNHLNHPEKKFKSVHVAGTNGKGSSSHMLASVLQEAGYKVGLYTSPHLKDFKERIKINGELIPEAYIVSFVEEHKLVFEKIEPSFFEWTVALAYQYFADEKVDIAVIEVGLGGRLDSTNVITPEVCLITNIGWDHMNLLGDTLDKIATEKAGIIKNNVPVVISQKQPELEPVFNYKATKSKAPIYFAEDEIELKRKDRSNYLLKVEVNSKDLNTELELDLPGTYQIHNIKGVLKTLLLLKEKGWKINSNDIQNGILHVKKNTGLMGRWQVIGEHPLMICDTGHNKDGILQVLENIKLTPHDQLHVVLGMVNDKDISGVLQLLPQDAHYYFCKPQIPRGLDSEELMNTASQFGLKGEDCKTVKQAIDIAKSKADKNDLIFVGGSTFVVADAL
jgi:dihydrofolate synthase/folylpolyglutamate synthase